MSKSLRQLLALLAGMVAAMVVTMALQGVGHHFFPLPPGLDPRDAEALAAHLRAAPAAALLAPLAGHLLGTLAGAWTAVRVARPHGRPAGLLVGVLMLSGAIANLLLIPHPPWFIAADLPGIGLAAWAGMALAGRAS